MGARRDIKTEFRVVTLFYILVAIFLLIIIGHILHLEQSRNQFYNVRDYSLMQTNKSHTAKSLKQSIHSHTVVTHTHAIYS